MSFKDQLKNFATGTYELGRGITLGMFAIQSYRINHITNNYQSDLYLCGSILIPVSMGLSTVGFGYMTNMIDIKSSNMALNLGGFVGIITCVTNLFNWMLADDTNLKNRIKKKPQTPPQPTKPSNVDPWCELEEPQTTSYKPQTRIDPWTKLESIVQ